LLGHTDLAYVRSLPKLRMGDLITTERGDQLLHRDTRGHPEPPALELRGADGAVVPCLDIAIRDTECLFTPAHGIEEDPEPLLSDDEAAELEAAIEHDAALIREWMDAGDPLNQSVRAGDEPWQESTLPRYQIMVTLFDDGAVP
jgi:hypothetical protein